MYFCFSPLSMEEKIMNCKLNSFTECDFNDKDLRSRFYKFIDKSDKNGCHIWKGSKNKLGYGWFHFKGKTVKSHRMAYILHYGSIPENKILLHFCDNPSCCNVLHLRAGTFSDNSTDMYSKGRGNNSARGLKGEKNKNSTLTEKDVTEIKKLFLTSNLTNKQIGYFFAVSRCTIADIRFGRTWKHI